MGSLWLWLPRNASYEINLMTTTQPTLSSLSAAPSLKRRALWGMAFRQRSVWLRAVKLGLTVGLLQATINQGDHWFRGELSRVVIIKSCVSPMIGFTLVLVSAAETWVQRTVEQNKV